MWVSTEHRCTHKTLTHSLSAVFQPGVSLFWLQPKMRAGAASLLQERHRGQIVKVAPVAPLERLDPPRGALDVVDRHQVAHDRVDHLRLALGHPGLVDEVDGRLEVGR